MRNKYYLFIIIVCNFFAFSGYGMKNLEGVTDEVLQKRIIKGYPPDNEWKDVNENQQQQQQGKIKKIKISIIRGDKEIDKEIDRTIAGQINEKLDDNETDYKTILTFLSKIKVNKETHGYYIHTRNEDFIAWVNNLNKERHDTLLNSETSIINKVIKKISDRFNEQKEFNQEQVKNKIKFFIENIKSVYSALDCFKSFINDFFKTPQEKKDISDEKYTKQISNLIIFNFDDNLNKVNKIISSTVMSRPIEDYKFFLLNQLCNGDIKKQELIMMIDKQWANKKLEVLKALIKNIASSLITNDFIVDLGENEDVNLKKDKEIVTEYIKDGLKIDEYIVNTLGYNTLKNFFYRKLKPSKHYSPNVLIGTFLKDFIEEICKKLSIKQFTKILYEILNDSSIESDLKLKNLLMFCLIRYNYHKDNVNELKANDDSELLKNIASEIAHKISEKKFAQIVSQARQEGHREYNLIFLVNVNDPVTEIIYNWQQEKEIPASPTTASWLSVLRKKITSHVKNFKKSYLGLTGLSAFLFLYVIFQRLYSQKSKPSS